jgi:hypothetical protein
MSDGVFRKLMASSRNKKAVVGAVQTTFIDVFALIASGDFGVLDCSLPDRSLAVGI